MSEIGIGAFQGKARREIFGAVVLPQEAAKTFFMRLG